ncbi:hypothetical protein PFISCL1PPCAC_1167 [Pristionchus fissidentatus]|uniref:Uncharacterized protein n=1 Tax=Pristionchus fissidentatus TaxID=1538716 RepID=A0AAV5UWD0_9BILA|nr:hypothetical protein PFISCL1PPCAC_1167 [Pristionchus fissidentatus]
MKFTIVLLLLLLTATFTVVQSWDCDDHATYRGSACWYHNIFYNGWQKRENRCADQINKYSFGIRFGVCYCCPPYDMTNEVEFPNFYPGKR